MATILVGMILALMIFGASTFQFIESHGTTGPRDGRGHPCAFFLSCGCSETRCLPIVTTTSAHSTVTASTTSTRPPIDSTYTLEVVFHLVNETFCATNNCYWAGLITYTGIYNGNNGTWGLNTGGYGNSTDSLIIDRCSIVYFQLNIVSNSNNPHSTLTIMMLTQSGVVLFSARSSGGSISTTWNTPC